MARTSSTDPLVGDVLDGRYEVRTRLARGGMATVYRAWDRRLERIVAIKVMHEGLDDDQDFAAKFDREARAAARLCDQNVVSIFDQGQDHGRPYIVMEFVEGCTLRNIISQQAPMSPLQALKMIEPVAAALAAAHESGLVHRDVKPENVLISRAGAVKVADFGLARSAQSSTATQGLLIGTVSYLPPELLTKGRAHSWSDVYSTGIVLFEMLTGTKPYKGDTSISVAYKHVNESVPAPSTVLGNRGQAIPDYIDALVLACTRRNTQERPADGRELLRRVRQARRALERGIRDDEALAAQMYPAGFLNTETATQVLADERPTSVLPLFEETEPTNPDELGSFAPDDDRRRVASPHEPVYRGKPIAERFPKLSKREAHRRRRLWLGLILVTLLTLGVATGAWWFVAGRYSTVPAVINQTQEEAARIADASGFSISFTEDYSETVPAGLVMSSDPEPGARVVRTTMITAVVSKGPERYAMPAVIGMSLEDATHVLEETHLLVGQVSEGWSETVEEGKVAQASAAEGDQLKRDTPIDLVISKGKEPLTIPSVVDMSREDARRTLEEAGFAVEEVEAGEHSSTPKDHIQEQSPKDGTGYRGDTITITVSIGPEQVDVPDVTGKLVAEGVKELQDAGFDVEVVTDADNPFRLRIKETDPAGGSKADKGSKIKVTLG